MCFILDCFQVTQHGCGEDLSEKDIEDLATLTDGYITNYDAPILSFLLFLAYLAAIWMSCSLKHATNQFATFRLPINGKKSMCQRPTLSCGFPPSLQAKTLSKCNLERFQQNRSQITSQTSCINYCLQVMPRAVRKADFKKAISLHAATVEADYLARFDLFRGHSVAK